MKGSLRPMPTTDYDKSSTIDFRFGAKSKVQPKGLDKLTLDAEVTVVLKGTIRSFSKADYDDSKRFSLDMKSCEILIPQGKEKSILDDALDDAKKTLKRVK